MRDYLQKVIVNRYIPYKSGILLLSPRAGKSRITIEIIKQKLKSKSILWVTPSTKLRDEDIPNEFRKWEAEEYLSSLTTVCYSSLHKVTGFYDLIVLDEIQNLTDRNSYSLVTKLLKSKVILGLTGTLSKSTEKQDLLSRLGLRVIDRFDIEEAIQSEVIAPYKLHLCPVELEGISKTVKCGKPPKEFLQTEKKYYDWITSVLETQQIKSKPLLLKRMRFIHNLSSKNAYAKRLVNSLKGRTLVFSANIEQSNYLGIPTYNSKTTKDNLNKFLNGEIDKLGCVNSGGVGYTFNNIDNLVLVQCDSNNNGISIQKLARSLVYREGYTANIYIIYAKDTVDSIWVDKVLSDLR